MPPKRAWDQVENGTDAAPPASRSRIHDASVDTTVPVVSRKVKACASCRKQKVRLVSPKSIWHLITMAQIKCLMDGSGPPCKRCAERNLSCVLNKSLQTLIEERSQ